MKTISAVEQEVNQIRLHIYAKTKDMTPTQLTEYYKQNTESIIQKYGFRVVMNANEANLREVNEHE